MEILIFINILKTLSSTLLVQGGEDYTILLQST